MTQKKMTALTGSAQTHPSPSHKTTSVVSVEGIAVIRAGIRGSDQPLGSMPLDWSSLRSTRLIHVASVVSPSCLATSSNCCLKSSCKRIWYWGERFSLCVDMVITISYILLHGNDHVSFRFHTKQRPAVLATHTGRLTKPLVEVTVMAMNKHTQTRPKYQYRFLAVSRQDRSVPPFRLCIDAGSEQEARHLLTPCFILSFAGQLPVQEAQNA